MSVRPVSRIRASAAVADGVGRAYIDREARKGKGPSDHAPVVVEFEPVGAGT